MRAKKPGDGPLNEGVPVCGGQASGLAVGLPDGQMGNSEVGHFEHGRRPHCLSGTDKNHKSLSRTAISSRTRVPLAAVENCKKNESPRFTCSDSYPTAASQPYHPCLRTLRARKEKRSRQELFVHCFLDGRDTPPASERISSQALEGR